MKTHIVLLAALALSLPAPAAITSGDTLARNMDDVHSLGFIYINHSTAGAIPPEIQASREETVSHTAPEAASDL